jgi:hypothetical protein
MLFHSYELYNNGLFFYEEMFKDIKLIYHNEKRNNFLKKFYEDISEKLKIQIRLKDIKNILINSSNDNDKENININNEISDYCDMIDYFEFVYVKFFIKFFKKKFYYRI